MSTKEGEGHFGQNARFWTLSTCDKLWLTQFGLVPQFKHMFMMQFILRAQIAANVGRHDEQNSPPHYRLCEHSLPQAPGHNKSQGNMQENVTRS
eukprot:3367849-Amphidinium_carterae.1